MPRKPSFPTLARSRMAVINERSRQELLKNPILYEGEWIPGPLSETTNFHTVKVREDRPGARHGTLVIRRKGGEDTGIRLTRMYTEGRWETQRVMFDASKYSAEEAQTKAKEFMGKGEESKEFSKAAARESLELPEGIYDDHDV